MHKTLFECFTVKQTHFTGQLQPEVGTSERRCLPLASPRFSLFLLLLLLCASSRACPAVFRTTPNKKSCGFFWGGDPQKKFQILHPGCGQNESRSARPPAGAAAVTAEVNFSSIPGEEASRAAACPSVLPAPTPWKPAQHARLRCKS